MVKPMFFKSCPALVGREDEQCISHIATMDAWASVENTQTCNPDMLTGLFITAFNYISVKQNQCLFALPQVRDHQPEIQELLHKPQQQQSHWHTWDTPSEENPKSSLTRKEVRRVTTGHLVPGCDANTKKKDLSLSFMIVSAAANMLPKRGVNIILEGTSTISVTM